MSYSLQRYGVAEASGSSGAVTAMARTSREAFGAQLRLNPIRCCSMRSNVAVPRRPTMKRRAWLLEAEAAQRAASSSDVTCSSVTTASRSKDRGDQRIERISSMGASVAARRSVVVTAGM